MDLEGAAEGKKGAPPRYGLPGEPATFWVADEYRPALLEVERGTGRTVQRFTARLADAAFDRPLDETLGLRRPNQGFEGLTRLDDGRYVASMQSPLPNPDAASTSESRLVRLLLFEPETGISNTLAYQLDRPGHVVSDLAQGRGSQILVLEHNGRGQGWIYAADLSRGTIVTPSYNGRTMEQLVEDDEIEESTLRPVPKRLVLDLKASGWSSRIGDPEGLVTLGARTLVVVNDNDYGLDDAAQDGSYRMTNRPTTFYTFRLPVPLWNDEDDEEVVFPLVDETEEEAKRETRGRLERKERRAREDGEDLETGGE